MSRAVDILEVVKEIWTEKEREHLRGLNKERHKEIRNQRAKDKRMSDKEKAAIAKRTRPYTPPSNPSGGKYKQGNY